MNNIFMVIGWGAPTLFLTFIQVVSLLFMWAFRPNTTGEKVGLIFGQTLLTLINIWLWSSFPFTVTLSVS